jgi:hypothetical protein
LFCLITFRLQFFSNLLLLPLSEGQIFPSVPTFQVPVICVLTVLYA